MKRLHIGNPAELSIALNNPFVIRNGDTHTLKRVTDRPRAHPFFNPHPGAGDDPGARRALDRSERQPVAC